MNWATEHKTLFFWGREVNRDLSSLPDSSPAQTLQSWKLGPPYCSQEGARVDGGEGGLFY